MHVKLKSTIMHVIMIVGTLSLSACANSYVMNNFCLWFEPITVTETELNQLSDKTLKQIDNVNQTWIIECDI